MPVLFLSSVLGFKLKLIAKFSLMQQYMEWQCKLAWWSVGLIMWSWIHIIVNLLRKFCYLFMCRYNCTTHVSTNLFNVHVIEKKTLYLAWATLMVKFTGRYDPCMGPVFRFTQLFTTYFLLQHGFVGLFKNPLVLLTLYFGNRVMCPASLLNKYML